MIAATGGLLPLLLLLDWTGFVTGSGVAFGLAVVAGLVAGLVLTASGLATVLDVNPGIAGVAVTGGGSSAPPSAPPPGPSSVPASGAADVGSGAAGVGSGAAERGIAVADVVGCAKLTPVMICVAGKVEVVLWTSKVEAEDASVTVGRDVVEVVEVVEIVEEGFSAPSAAVNKADSMADIVNRA